MTNELNPLANDVREHTKTLLIRRQSRIDHLQEKNLAKALCKLIFVKRNKIEFLSILKLQNYYSTENSFLNSLNSKILIFELIFECSSQEFKNINEFWSRTKLCYKKPTNRHCKIDLKKLYNLIPWVGN